MSFAFTFLDGNRSPGTLLAIAAAGIFAGTIGSVAAQDLEPRRWGHLPTGSHFAGGGYLNTTGEIGLDPVLLIEDVTVEMHTYAFKYIHVFEAFERSARIDLSQGYQDGTWEGLLDGSDVSTSRTGWSDTALRFAINLLGAPPLSGEEFAAYQAGLDHETIVGVGLTAVLPTGYYLDDRLLNLGENRYTFRPQIGMVHSRGPWSFEVTGSVWIFGDNDEFWNGNHLEVDPLVSLQGHLVHTFAPGLWLGLSAGHDFGGEATVNGIAKDDRRSLVSGAITLGVPVNRKVGLKFGYLGSRTLEDIGADLDTVFVAASVLW